MPALATSRIFDPGRSPLDDRSHAVGGDARGLEVRQVSAPLKTKMPLPTRRQGRGDCAATVHHCRSLPMFVLSLSRSHAMRRSPPDRVRRRRPPVRRVLRPLLRRPRRRRDPHARDGRGRKRHRIHVDVRRSGRDPRASSRSRSKAVASRSTTARPTATRAEAQAHGRAARPGHSRRTRAATASASASQVYARTVVLPAEVDRRRRRRSSRTAC